MIGSVPSSTLRTVRWDRWATPGVSPRHTACPSDDVADPRSTNAPWFTTNQLLEQNRIIEADQ